jgi:hypothetical protein
LLSKVCWKYVVTLIKARFLKLFCLVLFMNRPNISLLFYALSVTLMFSMIWFSSFCHFVLCLVNAKRNQVHHFLLWIKFWYIYKRFLIKVVVFEIKEKKNVEVNFNLKTIAFFVSYFLISVFGELYLKCF